MFVPFPAALVALVLLAGTSTTAQPPLPDCETSPARVELSAEPTGPVREVCIHPGIPITFHFDSSLVPGSVELQERECFEDVSTGTRSFTVLPPADLQPGERFKVGVRFADGAAPTSATFMLVGHPALGTRQVDVFRLKRTVEDYQREAQQEREKSQRLGQELERTRLEHGPGGLTGLFASGLMTFDDTGVKAKALGVEVAWPASNALQPLRVHSYRVTTRQKGVVRVAVAMELMNPGTQPWTLEGAALVGEGQEPKAVKVSWQSPPAPPGEKAPEMVVVEWELMAQDAQGPFTLKLWDEGGKRLITLGNVTFP